MAGQMTHLCQWYKLSSRLCRESEHYNSTMSIKATRNDRTVIMWYRNISEYPNVQTLICRNGSSNLYWFVLP